MSTGIEITTNPNGSMNIEIVMGNGDTLFKGLLLTLDSGAWVLLPEGGGNVRLGKHANPVAALAAALNHINKD